MKTKHTLPLVILGAVLLFGLGYVLYGSTDSAEVAEHEDEAVAPYEIYPGELATKLENNESVILLDVRTPEEYAELHLENSLLLPVQELSQQSLSDIGLDASAKDKEIYVYCRSGSRSKTAYDIMTSLGYTNVKSVAGGMIHWEEDNYPYTEAGPYRGGEVQAAQASAQAPKVVVDRALHDFGEIPQYGGTVQTTFTITNTGTSTLELGDITTSCSCTTAEVDTTAVEPSGSATLTVIFDPDFHEEPLDVFKRTVFVPTNDPALPELEVAVQVDIIEGK